MYQSGYWLMHEDDIFVYDENASTFAALSDRALIIQARLRTMWSNIGVGRFMYFESLRLWRIKGLGKSYGIDYTIQKGPEKTVLRLWFIHAPIMSSSDFSISYRRDKKKHQPDARGIRLGLVEPRTFISTHSYCQKLTENMVWNFRTRRGTWKRDDSKFDVTKPANY